MFVKVAGHAGGSIVLHGPATKSNNAKDSSSQWNPEFVGVFPRAVHAFSVLALGYYVSRLQRFCRFAAIKCRDDTYGCLVETTSAREIVKLGNVQNLVIKRGIANR